MFRKFWLRVVRAYDLTTGFLWKVSWCVVTVPVVCLFILALALYMAFIYD